MNTYLAKRINIKRRRIESCFGPRIRRIKYVADHAALELTNPEGSFIGQSGQTGWVPLHVACFPRSSTLVRKLRSPQRGIHTYGPDGLTNPEPLLVSPKFTNCQFS